jgi:hypothetical protein
MEWMLGGVPWQRFSMNEHAVVLALREVADFEMRGGWALGRPLLPLDPCIVVGGDIVSLASALISSPWWPRRPVVRGSICIHRQPVKAPGAAWSRSAAV